MADIKKFLDSNGVSTLWGLVTDAIDAEATRAKGAEKANADNLTTEITRAKGAEEAIVNSLDAEINRAKEAEKANKDAIDILNGDEAKEGSVKKQVADAVAKIIAEAPESFDTLKEISDWISSHSSDASEMNSKITQNTNNISALTTLIGSLPEGITATTIVAYIQEAVEAEKTRALAAEAQALTDAKSYTDTAIKGLDNQIIALTAEEVKTACGVATA